MATDDPAGEDLRPAPDHPESIVLVGMMGSGKSTVGRHLARACGFAFVDCDKELERRSGVTISTIFELEGEAGFRQREAKLLAELAVRPRTVLATGGGAVLLPENRRALREHGLVIYLDASADELARRVARDGSRPLLQVADPRQRIRDLLLVRVPLYREAAHLTFRSGASNPTRLVERILRHPAVAAVVTRAAA
ncbi:MAG TPA: shikimate kinase [Burkholderiaceae bacterium]|nr:shikimate kinase [Burkholderiaceae bacterium]